MKQFRPVFYVSDGTGITAETIGHSLLTQFAGAEFHTRRIAFVDNEEKALDVASQARQDGERAGVRSIIISTVIDGRLNAILGESGARLIDRSEARRGGKEGVSNGRSRGSAEQ